MRARHFAGLFAPERSVEECLRLIDTILIRAPQGSQDWEFADKIASQAARPDWIIGAMQLDYLRKLVDRYAPNGIAADPDLIPGASGRSKAEPVEDASLCEACGADGATLHAPSGRTLCASCAAWQWR